MQNIMYVHICIHLEKRRHNFLQVSEILSPKHVSNYGIKECLLNINLLDFTLKCKFRMTVSEFCYEIRIKNRSQVFTYKRYCLWLKNLQRFHTTSSINSIKFSKGNYIIWFFFPSMMLHRFTYDIYQKTFLTGQTLQKEALF